MLTRVLWFLLYFRLDSFRPVHWIAMTTIRRLRQKAEKLKREIPVACRFPKEEIPIEQALKRLLWKNEEHRLELLELRVMRH